MGVILGMSVNRSMIMGRSMSMNRSMSVSVSVSRHHPTIMILAIMTRMGCILLCVYYGRHDGRIRICISFVIFFIFLCISLFLLLRLPVFVCLRLYEYERRWVLQLESSTL